MTAKITACSLYLLLSVGSAHGAGTSVHDTANITVEQPVVVSNKWSPSPNAVQDGTRPVEGDATKLDVQGWFVFDATSSAPYAVTCVNRLTSSHNGAADGQVVFKPMNDGAVLDQITARNGETIQDKCYATKKFRVGHILIPNRGPGLYTLQLDTTVYH